MDYQQRDSAREDLISVVVPAYGVEEYIEKCLDSILRQTYRSLDIIVVDDGSKDNSGAIADAMARKDDRIRVFHKENGGLSDARNFGIRKARGKYVTCIDSDDYVDPDYVEYMVRLLRKYPCRIAIAQHRVLLPSGKVEDHGGPGDEAISARKCMERILYHDVLDTSAWGKLYERTLFQTVEYPKGKLFEDIGTTYKLLLQCDSIAVGYASKYNYVLRGNSIVSGTFHPRKLDLLEMTDHMAQDVLAAYPDLKGAVLRRRVYARFSTLNQMLTTDSWPEERKSIIQFIRRNGWTILKDRRAPRRDKAAIVLLSLSYRLYRAVWLKHQARRMKG